LHDPVAAGRRHAGVAARVVVDVVPVVADLAGPDETIAATGLDAAIHTAIGVVLVAVVTGLAWIDDAVAAAGDHAHVVDAVESGHAAALVASTAFGPEITVTTRLGLALSACVAVGGRLSADDGKCEREQQGGADAGHGGDDSPDGLDARAEERR